MSLISLPLQGSEEKNPDWVERVVVPLEELCEGRAAGKSSSVESSEKNTSKASSETYLHTNNPSLLLSAQNHVFLKAVTRGTSSEASVGNPFQVISAKTGKLVAELPLFTSDVTLFTVTKDLHLAFIGFSSGRVEVWDLQKRSFVREFKPSNHKKNVEINLLSLTADSKKLVIGSSGSLSVWDIELLKEAHSPIFHLEDDRANYSAIALSPDSKSIAFGYLNGSVMWFHFISPNKKVFHKTFHASEVRALAFSPDSSLLATGSWDKSAKILRVSSGECLQTLSEHTGPIQDLKFSVDGMALLTGSWDFTARVWRTGDGEELNKFSGFAHHIIKMKFSGSSRFVGTYTQDGILTLWEVKTSKPVIAMNVGFIFDFYFDYFNKSLRIIKADGSMQSWNLQELLGDIFLEDLDELALPLPPLEVFSREQYEEKHLSKFGSVRFKFPQEDISGEKEGLILAYSPKESHSSLRFINFDDSTVIVPFSKAMLKELDASTNDFVSESDLYIKRGKILLSSYTLGEVRVDEIDGSGKIIKSKILNPLRRHPINFLEIVPHSKDFISGNSHTGEYYLRSYDTTDPLFIPLQKWVDPKNTNENVPFRRMKFHGFSPDGKTFWAVDEKNAFARWSLLTGRIIEEKNFGQTQRNDSAISANGEVIAFTTWTNDKAYQLHVLNLKTGSQNESPSFKEPIGTPTLSPDGRIVATINTFQRGGWGLVQVWSIDDLTRPYKELRLPLDEIPSEVLISNNNKLLIANVNKKKTYGWNLTTGQRTFSLAGCNDYFFNLTFTPSNRHLLAVCGNRILKWYVEPFIQQVVSFEE